MGPDRSHQQEIKSSPAGNEREQQHLRRSYVKLRLTPLSATSSCQETGPKLRTLFIIYRPRLQFTQMSEGIAKYMFGGAFERKTVQIC